MFLPVLLPVVILMILICFNKRVCVLSLDHYIYRHPSVGEAFRCRVRLVESFIHCFEDQQLFGRLVFGLAYRKFVFRISYFYLAVSNCIVTPRGQWMKLLYVGV